jgi:hypothetical protein
MVNLDLRCLSRAALELIAGECSKRQPEVSRAIQAHLAERKRGMTAFLNV